jgi:hypothetical protein
MRDFVKSSNPDLTKIYRKHTQIKPWWKRWVRVWKIQSKRY